MQRRRYDRKFNLFKKHFGIEVAKDSLVYTFERDSIDSIHNSKPEETPKKLGGKIISLVKGADSVTIKYETGYLRVDPVNSQMLRLRWNLNELGNGIIYSQVESNGTSVTLSSDDREIVFGKLKIVFEDFSTQFYYDGKLVRTDMSPTIGDVLSISYKVRHDCRIYGGGERALPLDLTGEIIQMWNHDANGSYGPGDDPLYVNIPVLIDVSNDVATMCFFNNASKGDLDICSSEPSVVTAHFMGGEIDYYLAFGTPEECVASFSKISGMPMLPPKWSFGFHQSRYSYMSQMEVEDLVSNFQKYNLPLSAIHLDIDYMDGYRVFTADKAKFPDLKKLSEGLMDRSVRVISILDPGVKKDDDFEMYREGKLNEMFINDENGEIITGPVWPGMAAFPDFSSEAVRDWWSSKYRFFSENGIKGVWNDMNEPAVFVLWGDNTLPLYARQKEGWHFEVHNKYGLDMVRAGYQGALEYMGPERPFILSRSGWAGIQSYSFVWTGDVESTWAELRQTIPTIINLGISGIPYSGVDIGGFSGDPSEELFIRWFEVGSVLPFFRVHSAKGTDRREPWTFSSSTLEIIRKYLKFRYRILPYIYSISFLTHSRGIPIIRPMDWYPGGEYSQESFYVGEALLAYPVLKRNLKHMRISLPSGKWYNYWDNTLVEGEIEMLVDLEDFPLFVREGSMIPQDEGKMVFHIYPGESGKFIFYDDDSMVNPTFKKIEFTMNREDGNHKIIWDESGELGGYETLHFEIHGEEMKRYSIPISEKSFTFP